MRETNEPGLWTTGKMDRKHASSWRRRNRLHDDGSSAQNLSLELDLKKFDPPEESVEVLERLQSRFDLSSDETANPAIGWPLYAILCCLLKRVSMPFLDSWMLRKANPKERSGKGSSRLLMLLVLCLWLSLAPNAEGSPRSMSETLQRAFANSRGPSPGAKKLLNIPEDGGTWSLS